MAEEKRVLVKIGKRNWTVVFLFDGKNDQEVLKEGIKIVYWDEIPETSDFILPTNNKVCGGELVDLPILVYLTLYM